MPAPENLIIDTPEQIPLEFALAGVGSRFLALAFDTLLQSIGIAILVALGLTVRWLSASARPSIGPWAFAGLAIGGFVIYSGYFAIFESIWRGQTPGKRLVGLRVIDVSGRPMTVQSALVRNLLRIVDQVPGIYAVAIISVLVTRRNQRVGDLAAGTVVVREHTEAIAPSAAIEGTSTRYGAHRLAPAEVVLIEEFLRRRAGLDSLVRLTSARQIAQRMATRLALGPIDDDERLLERLAAEYRTADRYR